MAWGRQSRGGPQQHPRGTPVAALSELSPSGPEGCSPMASPASLRPCREQPRRIPTAKPLREVMRRGWGSSNAPQGRRRLPCTEHQAPALIPAWSRAVASSPSRSTYLLHKCPSTFSLQVQCPVLGSQVPTLPAGSQAQGLDGARRRRKVSPGPIPLLLRGAGLPLTCSRLR